MLLPESVLLPVLHFPGTLGLLNLAVDHDATALELRMALQQHLT